MPATLLFPFMPPGVCADETCESGQLHVQGLNSTCVPEQMPGRRLKPHYRSENELMTSIRASAHGPKVVRQVPWY